MDFIDFLFAFGEESLQGGVVSEVVVRVAVGFVILLQEVISGGGLLLLDFFVGE